MTKPVTHEQVRLLEDRVALLRHSAECFAEDGCPSDAEHESATADAIEALLDYIKRERGRDE